MIVGVLETTLRGGAAVWRASEDAVPGTRALKGARRCVHACLCVRVGKA